ncbi:NAD(P)-dependent alcohol dehydrogenase [Streptomyces sp. NPDC001604]|uniref:NAD(P)-dependent alcohol dehydrogenase n=1 Tax=Streptomyces sp. NPDC001604 TaxID=3364593 RepID=UPI0036A952BB
MLTVNAYAAASPTEPLAPTTVERRDLGPRDVLIEIKYCGICHTDIHWVRGDWGAKDYPVVPGHEIAGIVTQVGPEVTRHAVGDRVGVGCMVNSCRECGPCRQGEEQYCTKGHILTYGSVDRDGTLTQGGYSTHVVVDQDFVLRVPEGIGLDEAAPLLCAGVTTYSPLTRWGAGPGKNVGVIGLGGLGHVAVKLAKAMGAEVTVLSRTLAKKDDGLRLGADHYYATSDPATFEHLASTFDLIVNTVSAELDVDAYLSLLAVNGTLAIVGATPRFSLDRFSLVRNQRAFAGSQIGGIRTTQQMLDFCAEHGIGAEVEVIPAEQINEAYDRVLASDVRYRFVIDTSTLATTP